VLKPRNHNQVQLDHQELMVFPVTTELMVDLAHLDHQVHQDLLEVQVPEEADPEVIWVHLAHLAMLGKLVFPV